MWLISSAGPENDTEISDQFIYLPNVWPLDNNIGSIVPAVLHFHDRCYDRHNNSNRDVQVSTMVSQGKGVVSSTGCNYSNLLLVLAMV